MATVDLFIAAGQSNMAGRGTAAESPTVEAGVGYEWRDGGVGLVHLDDPMADDGSGTSPYRAQTGCMAPAFVNAFTAASGRPAVVCPTAVGGTYLLPGSSGTAGGWDPGGSRYVGAVARAQDAITATEAAGHTIATVSAVWHQGESDASTYPTPGTLEADYEAALIDLLARFRTDVDPDLRMYVCRLGVRVDYETESASIRAAQDAACTATDGMVMAYTRCVDFSDLGWMKADQVHYTQAGLNDMGTTAGQVAAADYGHSPPPAVAGPRTGGIASRLRSVIA